MEKIIKSKNISDFPIKKDNNPIININPSKLKIQKNIKNIQLTDIRKAKTSIHPKTERENSLINNLNKDENYSIEIGNEEEEEEEFNSDEYISSTMLDVETNTYIDQTEKKSNDSISNTNISKIKRNSPVKLSENHNIKKNYKENNENYSHKNKKSDDTNNKKIKINYNSSSPKLNKSNDKGKEIKYIKLNVQNNETKTEKIDEKDKKIKSKKNLKIEYKNPEIEKVNKNYSMIGYKSPLNALYTKEYPLKLDNINNNYINLVKKNNEPKKFGFKKMKLDLNNFNINIKKKNKTCKHKRAPTMINPNSINKNNNIKELIIKHKTKKLEENKSKKKNIISPVTKKIGLNSMKILNSIKSINHMETPSSLVNNFNKHNRIKYYNTNNTLVKNKNNTITINNNNAINTINLNNIKNLHNLSHINRIIFSPFKKRIDKSTNRNTTSSYSYNPFHSNSISIENNNNNISNKNNSNNKISDKLLTYNFQDQKYLSRNRTFKNKRHLNNKNKFFNLLLNKKKMNLIYAKDINNYKNNSKSKSPKIKNKINNLKKITDNLIKKNNKNIQIKNIGLQKIKSKNGNNNLSKNSYLNSYTNRKYKEQMNNKHNLYKRGKKYYPKQFIYIKKENLSNIVRQPTKKNYENNPFNQEKKNILNKNLSLSKSNRRYLNSGHSENKDKEFNINLTSANINKNSLKSKKIKLEISCKKKNKIRAKTLMEEDYLRDILINNTIKENENDKENYFKDYKYYKNNDKSGSNNISLNPNIYHANNYNERKTNYSPPSKDIIIKSPSEKHDINFNININMNNNDYKKLIYYYHGHNNSSINYSYVNNKERNSNLSFNPIQKKREINLPLGKDFIKKNSNDIYNNELNLNKRIDINHNIIQNYNNITDMNNSDNIPISFSNYNTNYNNNNYEENYDNISTIIKKNKNRNNNNFYISKNIKKQFSKNKINKNENKNNKEEEKIIKKNSKNSKSKLIKNKNNKKEYNLDNNNTFSNSEFEQSKSTYTKGHSNINIKLSNNNSDCNNFLKLNHSKKNNISQNKKNLQKKYSKEKGRKIKESTEPYDDLTEENLGSLDNYICKYYYENENIDFDNQQNLL